jgi:hypothetical protein
MDALNKAGTPTTRGSPARVQHDLLANGPAGSRWRVIPYINGNYAILAMRLRSTSAGFFCFPTANGQDMLRAVGNDTFCRLPLRPAFLETAQSIRLFVASRHGGIGSREKHQGTPAMTVQNKEFFAPPTDAPPFGQAGVAHPNDVSHRSGGVTT